MKLDLKDESGYFWIFGNFLGKVPKYVYTVSPVRWDTYFLVNRVENQKLNQTTAELPFCWVFGFQLCLRQTQALIRTYYIINIKRRRQGCNTKGLRATIARGPKMDGASRGPNLSRRRLTGRGPKLRRRCLTGSEIAPKRPKFREESPGATGLRKFGWPREFYGRTMKRWV